MKNVLWQKLPSSIRLTPLRGPCALFVGDTGLWSHEIGRLNLANALVETRVGSWGGRLRGAPRWGLVYGSMVTLYMVV